MKYEEIQALLERYWNAETTLEEERKIHAYFASGPIDARLQAFAPMFQALREEKAVQFSQKAARVSMRPQMYKWAAAASVALLLAAGWWLMTPRQTESPMALQMPLVAPQPVEKQQIEPKSEQVVAETKWVNKAPRHKKKAPRVEAVPEIDEETAKAMAEIKAALVLVSAKLDKGRHEAVKGASFLDAMEKLPRKKEG